MLMEAGFHSTTRKWAVGWALVSVVGVILILTNALWQQAMIVDQLVSAILVTCTVCTAGRLALLGIGYALYIRKRVHVGDKTDGNWDMPDDFFHWLRLSLQKLALLLFLTALAGPIAIAATHLAPPQRIDWPPPLSACKEEAGGAA